MIIVKKSQRAVYIAGGEYHQHITWWDTMTVITHNKHVPTITNCCQSKICCQSKTVNALRMTPPIWFRSPFWLLTFTSLSFSRGPLDTWYLGRVTSSQTNGGRVTIIWAGWECSRLPSWNCTLLGCVYWSLKVKSTDIEGQDWSLEWLFTMWCSCSSERGDRINHICSLWYCSWRMRKNGFGLTGWEGPVGALDWPATLVVPLWFLLQCCLSAIWRRALILALLSCSRCLSLLGAGTDFLVILSVSAFHVRTHNCRILT